MNQLHPHSHQDFICNNCQKRFYNETAYSPTQHSGFLVITYCFNCKETAKEEKETCSFREIDQKTQQLITCNKPLFDKKKALCRSHNRQVRNKFNEFTKDMSVSSMAAWEMQWEQSGDWRYFWGLGEEAIQKNLADEALSSEKELESIPSKTKKTWGSAPINETTENLQSLNLDKRTLKKTGRIHLFATRVKKEWMEQLKSIAYEERLKYVEVLENALDCYTKHLKKN